MKVKDIIISYDTGISLVIIAILAWILPVNLSADFLLSSYSIGITVLSIVFSLFFAAMAILMSSSDNDFICYMEEIGAFTELMKQFKFTLFSLFISLLYSIFISLFTDYDLKSVQYIIPKHYKVNFLIFIFLFAYSLIATFLNVLDTIKFSIRRAYYVKNDRYKKPFKVRIKRYSKLVKRIKK